ncbi:MAG: c-type cytochrome [Pseudohongiellaceae bacterium]
MSNVTSDKRSWSKLISLVSLCVVLLSTTATAQQTNPLAADPRAARAGAVIFRAQCATCHGADAKGISSIDAPDLTLIWTQTGVSEERVFSRIQDGVPGSIMPAHDFPDTEIWMLVSYLRSVAVAGSTREFTGDAVNGGRLFANFCSECHRAGGNGGSLGPNLERITQRRSQEALRSSIREPSSIISQGYKPIALRTEGAGEVTGIIKSEDAFSIQILDSNQRLRGFAKFELISSSRDIPSLMPNFTEQQLSAQRLDDILSFLNQQR